MDSSLFSGVDFAGEARRFLAHIRACFWNETGYFGKEHYIGTQKAFLWPYGGHLEAVGAQLDANPDSDHARQLYLDTLEGLRAYQVCREDDHLAYAAACGGTGDIYYDDNAWLVIAFLDASHRLRDPKWLTLAQKVCRFIYTGWDDQLGGGVYWMVGHFESKNTCINAPLAKVSAQLYQETGAPEYLEMAKKLYAWTKAHLMDPADGLYWDNQRLDGEIGEYKWTYNTGCMIGAGVHLYEITREQAYLEDAKRSAAAALAGFGSVQEDGYYRFTTGSAPWFNSWLLDGYLALYPHDPQPAYIYSFASALAYALQQKTPAGFLPQDWYSPDLPEEKVHILDQSGTATCLYRVHLWMQAHPEASPPVPA